jgi:hypothetical protein
VAGLQWQSTIACFQASSEDSVCTVQQYARLGLDATINEQLRIVGPHDDASLEDKAGHLKLH